jgi:hypothetical protein
LPQLLAIKFKNTSLKRGRKQPTKRGKESSPPKEAKREREQSPPKEVKRVPIRRHLERDLAEQWCSKEIQER